MENTFNFARGVPATEAFPVEQLRACAEDVLARDGATILQYQASPGYRPLREWLAARYPVEPGNVFVGNGSLQIAEFLSRILASPGDTVLVESPTYDRAMTLFRRAGLHVLGVPLQSDGYDEAIMESLVERERPRFFYTIPDFQNPSGLTTSAAKRRRLVELARTYDFWVLEDGPYAALRYAGKVLPTIHSMDAERVIHLSSFSKTISPGLRVGYALGPVQVVTHLSRFAEDTYITPNLLPQAIVGEFCLRGWLDTNIERLRQLYAPRLEALDAALASFMPQASWTKPEGGFFVGVSLAGGVDVADIGARAAGLGLRLSDGRGFFPDGEDGRGFLRLPFCALSAIEINEGLRRLASVVDSL